VLLPCCAHITRSKDPSYLWQCLCLACLSCVLCCLCIACCAVAGSLTVLDHIIAVLCSPVRTSGTSVTSGRASALPVCCTCCAARQLSAICCLCIACCAVAGSLTVPDHIIAVLCSPVRTSGTSVSSGRASALPVRCSMSASSFDSSAAVLEPWGLE
jgi:hypothetical protein